LKSKLLNFLKFLFFLGIGAGILYLVYRSQSVAFQEDCALRGIPEAECSLWRKVLNDFRGANFLWILFTLLAFTVSNVSRAIRWMMLLRPLGYRPRFLNSFLTILLGYFANLGLPRMGEVVRAGTMAQYEGIAVEKVMGTIVVDRIVDVISILLVTALAVSLEFDTIARFAGEYIDLGARFSGGGWLWYAAALAAAGAALLWTFRKQLTRTRLYAKLRVIAIGFKDGLFSIGQLQRPWLFLLHSLNIWLMYFLMTYFCFFAFAPTSHLSPLVGLVVFVFGGWGIVIPSPGGMGTYHFLVQTALQMYGVGGDDAFSWANIAFFSINIGCNVLLGIVALVGLPLVNRDYHPQPVWSDVPQE
jgi:uncharacterized protein (TIRG00374 family)